MPVSDRVKKQIWADAAGRCAICRKLLLDESFGASRTSLIGEVAHIVAEQPNGPRGDSPLTLEERNNSDNLLLLCLDHHKIVDDYPDRHSVGMLNDIKKAHREWTRDRLSQGSSWSFDCQNIFYLNVPRLEILARYLGRPIDNASYSSLTSLSDAGGSIARVLVYFEGLLSRLHPNAIPLPTLSMSDASIGVVCSFSQRFRTKNVGKALDAGWKGMTGNLAKDPHLYCSVADRKLVLPIDPRWLTTTTAGVFLSSGQGVFSGLCLINEIGAAPSDIFATPLLIGQAINAQMAGMRW